MTSVPWLTDRFKRMSCKYEDSIECLKLQKKHNKTSTTNFVLIQRLQVRDSTNYSVSCNNVFSTYLVMAGNTGNVVVKVLIAS